MSTADPNTLCLLSSYSLSLPCGGLSGVYGRSDQSRDDHEDQFFQFSTTSFGVKMIGCIQICHYIHVLHFANLPIQSVVLLFRLQFWLSVIQNETENITKRKKLHGSSIADKNKLIAVPNDLYIFNGSSIFVQYL